MVISRLLVCVAVASTSAGCSQLDQVIAQTIPILSTPPPAARPRPAPPAGEPRTAYTRSNVPPPIFGDWWYNMPKTMRTISPRPADVCRAIERVNYRTTSMYLPVNVPGGAHGGPSYVDHGWFSRYALCYAEELDKAGAPLAILIRERNCPFPYSTNGNPTSPGEVASMLDVLPKLDYLMMDLEPVGGGDAEDVIKNVKEIVRLVRSHPNPRISDAFIGNYNDWPGKADNASIWPKKRGRVKQKRGGPWDRNEFYLSQLNIAMPPVYPYQTYSRHTHPAIQKSDTSPTNRAAIFWAPLERLSGAARNLPAGHLLIPWVSNYVAFDKAHDVYNAPPPPREDLEAMIRHIRLRGAYSYMVWTANPGQTDHPSIDHSMYTKLAMDSWRSLDPFFSDDADPRILNLDTDKASGVQWSGMIAGDKVWVLVSNLGPRGGVTIELPDLPGLPDRTPPVPRGQHRLFRWRLDG